jgi:hypothetical protein
MSAATEPKFVRQMAEFQFRFNNRNNGDIFTEAVAGC